MSHHSKLMFATIVSVSDDADTNVFTVQNGDPIYVTGILIGRNAKDTAAVATVEMRDASDNVLGEIVVPVDDLVDSTISIDIPFYAANGLRFEVTVSDSVEIAVFHSQPGA